MRSIRAIDVAGLLAARRGCSSLKHVGASAQVDGALGSTPLLPHYRAGALRLLAQTMETRSPRLPDVPTFQEDGFKGLVISQWLGVFVPSRTPIAIVDRLNGEIGKALTDPVGGVTFNLEQPAGRAEVLWS